MCVYVDRILTVVIVTMAHHMLCGMPAQVCVGMWCVCARACLRTCYRQYMQQDMHNSSMDMHCACTKTLTLKAFVLALFGKEEQRRKEQRKHEEAEEQ